MKSVNPELSQRLDEIVTDKLNTSTSYLDTIPSEEEETQTNKDDHEGKKQHCMCTVCALYIIGMSFMYALFHSVILSVVHTIYGYVL